MTGTTVYPWYQRLRDSMHKPHINSCRITLMGERSRGRPPGHRVDGVGVDRAELE